MSHSSLLPAAELRETLCAFFEPRAAAVDAGRTGVREGIAFVAAALDGDECDPNANLNRICETLAAVAWSDMSTAFSLWCQRMVLEYLATAPDGSFLREEVLPSVARTEHIGSTALASGMAHAVSGTALPVHGRFDTAGVTLEGRITWASNLFPPDLVMVTAGTNAETGEAFIVAIPGDAPGVRIDPYPRLLALQQTNSSSVTLDGVRLGQEWVVSHHFPAFIGAVRGPFLLTQSSYAWGLGRRALDEARKVLRAGAAGDALAPDLERLEAEAGGIACTIRTAARARGHGTPVRGLVQLRLDAVRFATTAVALEAKAVGGRCYLADHPTGRRLREAAFLPVQAPTEAQLRWELSHSAS